MALVVICGQPSSGKSTAATCLAEALRDSAEPKPTVRIITETLFHLDGNQSYANMTAEKNVRGVLRSEVDRSVSKDNIIFVDSLNSIKSYRYELWCLAHAAGVRYCVLYCDMENFDCRKWNEYRKEKGEAAYDESIFEDLLRSPPLLLKVRPSDANLLYELDRVTQEVMNAIVTAQCQAFGGSLNGISIDQGLPTINIQSVVGLPELRRLRRTFVKLTGQTSLRGRPPPSDSESAKRMFVDYLNRELGA